MKKVISNQITISNYPQTHSTKKKKQSKNKFNKNKNKNNGKKIMTNIELNIISMSLFIFNSFN